MMTVLRRGGLLAVALLVLPPGALVVAFDDHMDTLDDIAQRIVVQRENALQAQDVRPL